MAAAEQTCQVTFSAPEPWAMRLIRHCQDPQLRLALFQTSRQWRDIVMLAAPAVTLTLPLHRPSDALAASGPLLALRSKGQTCVSLRRLHLNSAAVLHALQQLSIHPVTALALALTDYLLPGHQAILLSAAARALPHLTTLHLDYLATPLPPPAQWQHLTDLRVDRMDEASLAFTSLQHYLHCQLHKLTLKSEIQQWHRVLTEPGCPALTHLSVQSDLGDRLLGLLLQHAPALQEIECVQMNLHSDWSDKSWNVRKLVYSSNSTVNDWWRVHSLCALTELPRQAHAQSKLLFELSGDRAFSLHHSPHLDPSRLSQLQLKGGGLTVHISVYEPSDSAWLRPLLEQLSAMVLPAQHSPTTVELDLRVWDDSLLQTAANIMKTQPHVRFAICTHQWDDHTVTQLLQLGSICKKVTVAARLQQLSGQHSSWPWPWEELVLAGTNRVAIQHLLCLPDLAGVTRCITLESRYPGIILSFTPQEVAEGVTARAAGWLKQVRWHIQCYEPPTRRIDYINYWVCAPLGVDAEEQPALLRAHLSVLRAAREVGQQPCIIDVCGWEWTAELAAELAGLPDLTAEDAYAVREQKKPLHVHGVSIKHTPAIEASLPVGYRPPPSSVQFHFK